jgi:nucleotide-binding universal stress UspA family protein
MAGRIVVGVDGSRASKEALSWAVGEARLREDTVVALHASMPPYTAPAALPGALIVPVEDGTAEAIRKAAEELLAEAVSEAAAGDVTIEQRLVEGPAAGALIEEAKGAQLLVVGSRGHGGFTGLLLGSVSQQCAQHAPCPVVIVRVPENDS